MEQTNKKKPNRKDLIEEKEEKRNRRILFFFTPQNIFTSTVIYFISSLTKKIKIKKNKNPKSFHYKVRNLFIFSCL